MATQLIIPNPNVACTPGYCLKYVQDAAGLKAVYPTAKASWNASTHKHFDYNFPGAWVPLWFDYVGITDGHVVWRQPDGSIWSASSPTAHTPIHHASLDALLQYYGQKLKYLGWTEDLEGTLVIGGTMDKITKEQEISLSVMQTGSEPGKDYDYRFTGKPLTQLNLDALLQFWAAEPRPSSGDADKRIKAFKDALGAL